MFSSILVQVQVYDLAAIRYMHCKSNFIRGKLNFEVENTAFNRREQSVLNLLG
jgi:hypothetical protein